VKVHPAREGTAQVVIVKGQERQATIMYSVRRRVVSGVLPDEPAVVANDYDFMADFDVPGYLLTPNSAGSTSESSQVFVYPATPIAVPYSAMVSPYPFFPETTDYRYVSYQSNLRAMNFFWGDDTSTDSSSNRRATPSSGIEDGSSQESPSEEPLPDEAPLASGILKAAKKLQADNSWRAPGAERNANVDYDTQQLLATKAMMEHPQGPRVPTDHWSGLGFSRSMPMAVKPKEGIVELFEESHLETVEEQTDENKIGPWTMTPATKPKKVFNNTTTYFDCGGLIDLNMSDGEDVSILLTQLHLVKFVDIFREQEIDMGTFLTMTDADLKELGVNTFGARRKLLVVISELKEHRRRGQ